MAIRLSSLFAALTVAACSHGSGQSSGATPPNESPALASLVGSEWKLADLPGATLVSGATPTLAFPSPGKVAGNGSCNRFNGPVSGESGAVKLGPLVSTRMACPPPVMEQETKYLAALNGAERFAMNGDALLLYTKASDQPLRFVRAQ